MRALRSILSSLCIAAACLASGAAFAQVAEACGKNDELLFYCTFKNGARQVGLCYSDGIISYSFGPSFQSPELTMKRALADVSYTPFSWASNTIFESVELVNIDTSYEVFSSRPRGLSEESTAGGITVTLPNGKRHELTCDMGSVWPYDPLEGIGKLSDDRD